MSSGVSLNSSIRSITANCASVYFDLERNDNTLVRKKRISSYVDLFSVSTKDGISPGISAEGEAESDTSEKLQTLHVPICTVVHSESLHLRL